MNSVTASCGHHTPAVGADGSIARIKCVQNVCVSCMGEMFADLQAYLGLNDFQAKRLNRVTDTLADEAKTTQTMILRCALANDSLAQDIGKLCIELTKKENGQS